MTTFSVWGPGNFQPRVMSHGVAVYREGATLTPAPPAHGAQPNTVIHQITGKPLAYFWFSLISQCKSEVLYPLHDTNKIQ